MEDDLKAIVTQASEEAPSLQTMPEYEAFKAKYVGPNGRLTQVSKGIGKLSKEERPLVGKLVNETKKALDAILQESFQILEQKELAGKIGPEIDPTLPSLDAPRGSRHPLTEVRRLVNDIFRKIGFSIAEGPEVESEWFCFDALNTPKDHPARNEQDTLYLPAEAAFENISKRADERYILRTHTSSVQVRTMLDNNPPLRIIAPGRAFRRDTVDATHSANFHQVEALCVDKHVTIKDLKATLDYLFKELFGKNVKIRLRPSFFPFTEPSFEMDLKSPNLGALSDQWIEVLGCGLVDPEVFKSVGYDPEKWGGYAFGMGIERIAMMMYGIDDIRHFYQNDLRFLKQLG